MHSSSGPEELPATSQLSQASHCNRWSSPSPRGGRRLSPDPRRWSWAQRLDAGSQQPAPPPGLHIVGLLSSAFGHHQAPAAACRQFLAPEDGGSSHELPRTAARAERHEVVGTDAAYIHAKHTTVWIGQSIWGRTSLAQPAPQSSHRPPGRFPRGIRHCGRLLCPPTSCSAGSWLQLRR